MSQMKGNPFNLHLHSLYFTLTRNNVARTLCICGVENRVDSLVEDFLLSSRGSRCHWRRGHTGCFPVCRFKCHCHGSAAWGGIKLKKDSLDPVRLQAKADLGNHRCRLASASTAVQA